jgi:hypothetical protein
VHAAGAASTKTATAGMTSPVIRIRPPCAKARIIHNLIGAHVPSIETLERERCAIDGTTDALAPAEAIGPITDEQ